MIGQAWRRITARGRERGSMEAAEGALLLTGLLILMVLGVAAGQIVRSNSAVDAAATGAARAATVERTVDAARAAALEGARAALADRGLQCLDLQVDVDLSAADSRVAGSAVRATVSCRIELSVYAVPGLPGSKTVTATGVSPVEVFREGAT